MKFIGLLFSMLMSLHAAASEYELQETTGFPNTLGAQDFFMLRTDSARTTRTQSLEDCRATIAQVICLVDPVKEGQKPMERACLPGGEAYASHFEALFDNYPPSLQRMFCSLRRIFIENSFFGTAFAGSLKNRDGKLDGAMIGIRRSVLDEKLDLPTWASWKEQLSFGGIAGAYRPLPDLPMIVASTQSKVNDFVYFVITHEFGHLFDFANGLNKKNCPPKKAGDDPECEMADGTWGALSWLTNKTVRPEEELAHRADLCFYLCKGKKIPRTEISSVYDDLDQTSFISLYAATNPLDDFADSLAYYLSARNIQLRYSIDTRQGEIYDIEAKLHSEIFAHKLAYIENFLSRKNIIYP